MRSDNTFDGKLARLLVAIGFAAIGITAFVANLGPAAVSKLVESTRTTDSRPQPPIERAATVQVWAASAPGRVEPKGGLVHFRAETSGQIMSVYARQNDVVKKGDLLVQLKDDDYLARLRQAKAEVAVRLGERNEDVPEDGKKPSPLVKERRAAADAFASAERAIYAAQVAFDEVFLRHRNGGASEADLAQARQAIAAAEDTARQRKDELEAVRMKPNMPDPTRLDSGLALARADLRLAELAHLRTRVRAPVAGRVLRIDAQVGETTSPSQPVPLALIGDTSSLQVLAEVQERDISKVAIGQEVVVRSQAHEGRDFAGKVTEIAPSVGAPAIRSQGPKKRLDVEVLEVVVELAGKPPLKSGMRVDVFFRQPQQVSSIQN